MADPNDKIDHCHSCGMAMDISGIPPFTHVRCPTCSKATRVKCDFGPYTLLRRHAVGGMSMVYVAKDNLLGREVALKILSEEFSSDQYRIKSFEEEARITASFNHPNVVRVFTTGKAFGRFYIAMELVPGGHFEHQINERGKIPEIEMLALAIEVAQGLKAANAAGLIHRDMKPGNILLDSEGHAKIVDFGLALVTQGGVAQATEFWATPYYVPPETIEGRPEDFRSDIYAFGATLYHALSGIPSCSDESLSTEALREAKKKVIPLGTLDPSLSVDVCRIVDRAMAYDPEKRFSSYDALMAQLEDAYKHLRAGVAVESSGTAAKRRLKNHRVELVVGGVAGLALVMAVFAGIWWVTRDSLPTPKPQVSQSSTSTLPDLASDKSNEIAASYRVARSAVEAGEFEKAAAEFTKLRENKSVQEPTRSWAGVEAVMAWYLAGDSVRAKAEAKDALAHASAVEDGKPRLDKVLITVLGEMNNVSAISSSDIDNSLSDPPHLIAWMLAGLKNWEQGMLQDAGFYFNAVLSAKISADDYWLKAYQKIAGYYLVDLKSLTSPVFAKLPDDFSGCGAAAEELNDILASLKTRGRARYNVQAWQLDLKNHANRLMDLAKAPAVLLWDRNTAILKLEELSKDYRFAEASDYLSAFPARPVDAMRVSFLSLTEAAAEFLEDLNSDVMKKPARGEYFLKSGEVVTGISLNSVGDVTMTDSKGVGKLVKWADFKSETLVDLYRAYVKDIPSNSVRLRRYERAIAYAWLAGDRQQALKAAASLADIDPEFKKRWDKISQSLPK